MNCVSSSFALTREHTREATTLTYVLPGMVAESWVNIEDISCVNRKFKLMHTIDQILCSLF